MISNKVRLTVNFQATTLTMMKKPADNVLVNDNQQIECRTDSSNPAVQIQWFTYSFTTWKPLVSQPATSQTSAANHGFVATSALSITATKSINQARYRCQTGNLYKDTTITVYYPPSSVALQGPTSPVRDSTSVDFTCTATGGNPVPNLLISRTPVDGSTVKQGVSPLTYSTSVTKTDNQAKYQCTATGAGIPTPMISNKFVLTVNFQATSLTMVKKPADRVLFNNNQQMECKTDSSNPAVQIQWFIYSSTTWTALVSQPTTSQTSAAYHGFMATSALSITATKSMNQAQYRCQTGNLYKDTTITVHYPPSNVTLLGPTSPVQESAPVSLTCTATGSNPVPNLAITRTPGGSTVKQGVTPLTYSTSVTKTDNQAEYQCTATGASIPTPMISNKVILTVNFQATALTMAKKPKDYVSVNNNQHTECKTDSSNPAVQIQWFIYFSTTWTLLVSQPATSQTTADNHGLVATSTLSITATKTMNQARYRCQTGNLYKDTTITVYFPPESITLTEIPNGPVVQGTSKTLTCTTDSSNPVSTIMWAYSSGTTTWTDISPNPAVHHKPGSHSGQTSTCNLVVSTDKDKNGRQYRCTAYQNSQPVNGVTKSTTLSILYAPQLSSQVGPIAANIGESARFTINYNANPRATTLYCSPDSRNGRRLMKNTGLTQWDVIIQSVQASDYGSYSCRLNNSVGSAEITLKLTETGTPQTPSNLSVIAKTAVSVTLSWVSEFEGAAKQTFTVRSRASDSTQFVNKAEIPDPGYRKLVQTKITGLKPATDYQFKVKSVNSNPGDNTSPFTDIVTTRTNAIPSAMNLILKQATITRDGNLVLIRLPSFPSKKYRVYVEYCIENTNRCNSTKPIEITDGFISITINIDSARAYSYKLMVTESNDVIASHEVKLEEDDGKWTVASLVPLMIAGVILGSIAFSLVLILMIVLQINLLRNRGCSFINKSREPETGESTVVYSNSNEARRDTDSHSYAAATPYVNVAFSESIDDPNPYEEVRN
ncbi:nephrin-like [Tubulanus polymorphus]|uniref:nephrin-like n=1 Tax=Tubulanus polymorphus TaxID=672921 RepID=UPI003DA6AF52